MKDKICISAVIPVYKNDFPHQVSESIDSLLHQTYPVNELIIIIDGPISNDLRKVVFRYSKEKNIKILENAINEGLSKTLNTAIRQATYPYIARMDSDDIAFPDRLERQVKLLKEKNLDLVGGQTVEFGDNKDDIKSERKVPEDHLDIIDFMKFRSPFSHPTVLFKKSLFDKVKGYSETFKIEDYEFFVRCHMHKARFGNTKESLLWYRMGGDNSTLKRRWGRKYAIDEFKLYFHFLKIGFYNKKDFLKAVIFKIPLRLIPYPIFSLLYRTIAR